MQPTTERAESTADYTEQSNAQRKAELKAFKAEVDNMRQESIRLAKENNSSV
jgi:hypothetical protein